MSEFIVGVIPARRASLTQSLTDSHGEAPKLSKASISDAFDFTSENKRSSERAMPFIELPRIMPKIGMAILAEYQGSGDIIRTKTIVPTRKVLAQREKKPRSIECRPARGDHRTAVPDATRHIRLIITIISIRLLRLKIYVRA